MIRGYYPRGPDAVIGTDFPSTSKFRLKNLNRIIILIFTDEVFHD